MDELDDALAAAVEGRFESEQVPFLAALVDQPSCSREPADVELAARLIDERAEALGLGCERHEVDEGRFAAHRVYAPRALGAAPALALIGHVDTVFPRSVGFFGFRREGDTAFGPGVLDMKSGLSAIFGALEAIRAVDATGFERLPVRVVVTADEEVGSETSRPLLDALAPNTTGALVFEAGRAEDRIITARKGGGRFRVEARGVSAHAGLAHRDGVNAIAALAHVIPALEAITDYARGITVNIGLIEGGTSSNTVPDRAWCSVDCRHEHRGDDVEVERALRDALVLPASLEGASLELEGRFHRPPMMATEASRALMRAYGAQALAVGLGAEEAPLQGGGSDANLMAAAGVPSIDGLGPAGSGVHRTSERCSLESLRKRTLALARYLVRAH